jgi:serine/threonine protein kinase
VVAQVCNGFAHVHARAVIHGDVSLGHALIGRADGTASLVDFGVATRLDGPLAVPRAG